MIEQKHMHNKFIIASYKDIILMQIRNSQHEFASFEKRTKPAI